MNERFLVTGASGCIGAWVVRELTLEGASLVATDLNPNMDRIRLLLDESQLEELDFVRVDVVDGPNLKKIVREKQITHIIHLAGLQVPFCKADPPLGAQVNVVGTLNVLEAAKEFQEQVKGLVYASSIAVLGPPDLYSERPVRDDVRMDPRTLYGVYKVADEGAAAVYWNDWGVGSVGLRPYIVYGVGRDQGMTSDLAKSILAAVAGRPYKIKFNGPVAMQFARDVAKMFVQSARLEYEGAIACNLRNDVLRVEEFVEKVNKAVDGAQVTCADDQELPFPCDLDDSLLRDLLDEIPYTPADVAIEETAESFRDLLAAKRINLSQL